MENHGLITNSDDCEDCITLDHEVNSLIKKHLKINDIYPNVLLETIGENSSISRTSYLTEFFINNIIDPAYFDDHILYPDQLVYLNSSLSLDGESNKLSVNPKTCERIYRAGEKEAISIEETLLGVVYVISKVKECGLALRTMPKEGVDFIRNWESEKYRKTVAGGK